MRPSGKGRPPARALEPDAAARPRAERSAAELPSRPPGVYPSAPGVPLAARLKLPRSEPIEPVAPQRDRWLLRHRSGVFSPGPPRVESSEAGAAARAVETPRAARNGMEHVRRRIAVVSGIRSEYDILYAVMDAIRSHPELELEVVLTGAHLSSRFGASAEWALRDGFPVAERIESLFDSDTGSGRVRGAAVQLLGLSQSVLRLAPDFLLVCGDREEAITSALVGAYCNVPVAHLAGGDLAVGNVDDSVRHAVTKLAHLHLTFSEKSAERVRRLGEEEWRVHAVGNPALDRFRSAPPLERRELEKELGCALGAGPLALVVQHAISSESGSGADQLRTTLEAVASIGCRALVGMPNSDAGSRAMLEAIREQAALYPQLHPIGTLPRDVFVNLLRETSVLVGNSSMGLLEAPFLGLPVVNVGRRQGGREHAQNVLFVPHERGEIAAAIRRCLSDPALRERIERAPQPFGDGRSGPRIAELLARAPERERLLLKRWTY